MLPKNDILPPAEGKAVSVTFRVPETMLRRIDAVSAANGHKRTVVLLHLIRWALEQLENQNNPPRKTG